jgi:hypothetical protein
VPSFSITCIGIFLQKKSLSWYSSMTAYEAASGELRWIWAWIHKQRSTRWTWFA